LRLPPTPLTPSPSDRPPRRSRCPRRTTRLSDFTGGCTLEAHNFQRDLEKYKAANAVVLGVSLDTADSHKSFCTKESLSFKLLADPSHKVVDEYGVPVKTFDNPSTHEKVTIAVRQTFLIDPSGKIVKFWNVTDIPNHSAEVLAAIAAGK
jgi:peroxiredoxin Q/BCP